MKKVLSVAAAMTLLSTGAFGFESLKDGTIVTSSKVNGIKADWIPVGPDANLVTKTASAKNYIVSKYTGGVKATTDLKKSTFANGDALIYPAFSQAAGFATEIVVRNTKNVATVAKVVLYSADTTREVVDFNIYLSPNDVFRFKIADGKLTTSDDSIAGKINWPHEFKGDDVNGKREDTVTMNEMGTEVDIVNQTISEKTGYVVVYGMANAETTKKAKDQKLANYHKNHAQLVKDYRLALDLTRSGWREAFQNNFQNGMMKNVVPAPNVAEEITYVAEKRDFRFTDVDPDSLTGTVKIIRSTEGFETDMILPATAIRNYTDGNILLWTEGEYAAIQDRRIDGGKYVKADILKDAKAFEIGSGLYTYEAGTKNNLIFTQPFKRILVQLGDPARYYHSVSGWNYKGFQTTTELFDEAENTYVAQTGTTIITSPINASSGQVSYLKEELAVLKDTDDLQNNEGYEGFFAKKNGFGYISIKGGKIPAIATQWVGSTVNGKPSMNWIYAPIN